MVVDHKNLIFKLIKTWSEKLNTKIIFNKQVANKYHTLKKKVDHYKCRLLNIL
jgi:hypothetical protein